MLEAERSVTLFTGKVPHFLQDIDFLLSDGGFLGIVRNEMRLGKTTVLLSHHHGLNRQEAKWHAFRFQSSNPVETWFDARESWQNRIGLYPPGKGSDPTLYK